MKKKVLISAGGTGGHVYPALALAGQLQKKHPEIELLFVGGKLGTNRFFTGHPYPFQEVSCSPLSSKNPFNLFKSCSRIIKGVWQSRRIIKDFCPDVVVGFGSYHTFPTLFASKLIRVPVVLHEANSIPGKVIRFMSRHVDVTGVHFPDTMSLLSGPTVEVGMPLRQDFQFSAISRQEALKYFGLSPDLATLLVFGGSQGARAINRLIIETVCDYLSHSALKFQVLHFTGDILHTGEIRKHYMDCGIKACVKDFETRMDFAWKAADIVVSRAGASTIAELMEFEVPAILIPFPFAADQHQDKNAEFMVAKVGGALKYTESSVNGKTLAQAILKLLSDDQSLLKGMRQAMRQYKKRKGRTDLCSLVCEILEGEIRR